jgi:hypothetical protein
VALPRQPPSSYDAPVLQLPCYVKFATTMYDAAKSAAAKSNPGSNMHAMCKEIVGRSHLPILTLRYATTVFMLDFVPDDIVMVPVRLICEQIMGQVICSA